MKTKQDNKHSKPFRKEWQAWVGVVLMLFGVLALTCPDWLGRGIPFWVQILPKLGDKALLIGIVIVLIDLPLHRRTYASLAAEFERAGIRIAETSTRRILSRDLPDNVYDILKERTNLVKPILASMKLKVDTTPDSNETESFWVQISSTVSLSNSTDETVSVEISTPPGFRCVSGSDRWYPVGDCIAISIPRLDSFDYSFEETPLLVKHSGVISFVLPFTSSEVDVEITHTSEWIAIAEVPGQRGANFLRDNSEPNESISRLRSASMLVGLQPVHIKLKKRMLTTTFDADCALPEQKLTDFQLVYSEQRIGEDHEE